MRGRSGARPRAASTNDGSGRSSRRARDDEPRGDRSSIVGVAVVGLERAELGDRAAADGDDDPLAGPGPPHGRGQLGAQLADPQSFALPTLRWPSRVHVYTECMRRAWVRTSGRHRASSAP